MPASSMGARRHITSRLIALVAVVALLAVACGSGESESDAGSDASAGEAASDSVEPTEPEPAEPDPTPEPEPTPTPELPPTPEPEPTPTPEPDPTPEPEPDPTPEPEPEPEPAGALASGCGIDLAPGVTTVEFDFEDRIRTYQLLIPAGYAPDEQIPVVLNWHGLGSDGTQQLSFSNYAPVADRESIIVVSPTGIPSPGDDRNSWELDNDQDPTRDDLALANHVLDHVIESTCVDQSRVYSTGMSNGGYFTGRLVCEMSERIAAAASVAGLTHEDDCEPTRNVPFLAFHGTDDATVPFDGDGYSSLAPDTYLELFDRAIPDEFAEFAEEVSCDPGDVEAEDVSDLVTKYTYGGCNAGISAVFYEVRDAGHTWPGSPLSLAISEGFGLGVTNADISATELSWEFFAAHSLEQ